MSPDEYIQTLIADYLHSKGMNETLFQFEKEVNRRFNTSVIEESLETILHDRINFNQLPETEEDLNGTGNILRNDKLHGLKAWSVIHPTVNAELNIGPKVLIIGSCSWKLNHVDYELFITNTNRLIIYNLDTHEVEQNMMSPLDSSAIMKTIKAFDEYIVICDMNGVLNVFRRESSDWSLGSVLATGPLKLHRRLITEFQYLPVNDGRLLGYFGSIGWDGRFVVGKFVRNEMGTLNATIIEDFKLSTNPTSFCLSTNDTGIPFAIVGRLNSTLLSLFTIREHSVTELSRVSLNDSEFSNHSFQPMSIVNIEGDIFSVGTDHIPYMRLITIKLPSIAEILDVHYKDLKADTINEKLNCISSTQDHIQQIINPKIPVIRNVIISNYNTNSPQDKYSQAILLPRSAPDSGIWIIGDDGKIRGFDLTTGRVMATLNSNDGRAKCAHISYTVSNKEYLIFCGAVDKRVSCWTF